MPRRIHIEAGRLYQRKNKGQKEGEANSLHSPSFPFARP
jgi:hypothetical protein